MRLLPDVTSPLRGGTAANVDRLVVRENTEGEPAALVAGIAARGPGKQVALQMGLFTEEAIWAVPSLAASALPARLGPRISRAGKGIANPIGQLWSAVLMLEHRESATPA